MAAGDREPDIIIILIWLDVKPHFICLAGWQIFRKRSIAFAEASLLWMRREKGGGEKQEEVEERRVELCWGNEMTHKTEYCPD